MFVQFHAGAGSKFRRLDGRVGEVVEQEGGGYRSKNGRYLVVIGDEKITADIHQCTFLEARRTLEENERQALRLMQSHKDHALRSRPQGLSSSSSTMLQHSGSTAARIPTDFEVAKLKARLSNLDEVSPMVVDGYDGDQLQGATVNAQSMSSVNDGLSPSGAYRPSISKPLSGMPYGQSNELPTWASANPHAGNSGSANQIFGGASYGANPNAGNNGLGKQIFGGAPYGANPNAGNNGLGKQIFGGAPNGANPNAGNTGLGKQIFGGAPNGANPHAGNNGLGNQIFGGAPCGDWEELTSNDIADAFEQMHKQRRYKKVFWLSDTCQAASLQNEFYTPGIVAMGSSDTKENSYSLHADSEIGCAVVDRFSFYAYKYLKKLTHMSDDSLEQFHKSFSPQMLHSHPQVRHDLYGDSPSNIRLTEFFASTGTLHFQNSSLKLLRDSHDGEMPDTCKGQSGAVSGSSCLRSAAPPTAPARASTPRGSSDVLRSAAPLVAALPGLSGAHIGERAISTLGSGEISTHPVRWHDSFHGLNPAVAGWLLGFGAVACFLGLVL